METEKHIDLGAWLGRQQAFATVAGGCTAARAQCLQQIRDSGMLDELGITWEEFCKDYAGISRTHADELIRQHERFGDVYFRLSEIARVSPRTFQQIAPHVDGDTIEIDGEHLELIPANASKIRTAIKSLCDRARRERPVNRPPAELTEFRVRIDALAADIRRTICSLGPGDCRDAHSDIVNYGANKFRALARLLEKEGAPEPGD
jgi:hypothetical protein